VEECQPRQAGRLFQVIGGSGYISLANAHRQAQPDGQFPDEFRVLPRFFAPELVVEMQHAQVQIPYWRQLQQGVEEAHGISAARDSHANGLAGVEHAMALDGMNDAVEQENTAFIMR
jgi:hypothetical protein